VSPIATTKTLAIKGGVKAGLYQIFSCTGTGKVVFGQAQILFPQWWGVARNGTTDDLPALQSCINSAVSSSLIEVSGGSYLLNGYKLAWPATVDYLVNRN
jgi:hypothetical protein